MLRLSNAMLLKTRWIAGVWMILAGLLLAAAAPLAHAFEQVTYTGNTNFGTLPINTLSAPQTLTFTFSSLTTLNATTPVQVLTQGYSGYAFKNAGTGTCASGSFTTCTVDVTFSAAYAGLRQGAVILEDAAGNVLITVYVYGVGQGPQLVFNSVTPLSIGTGTTDPQGVVVDRAGDVYIADGGTDAVYKVVPGGAQTTIPTGGLTGIDGIALDGAGNLYVSATSSSQILKITPAGVQTWIGSGLLYPSGMATDGEGNLYVANTGGGTVVEVTPAGVQSTLGSGFASPAGVAVDYSGNLYIADAGSNKLFKITSGGVQSTLISSLLYPESVAVDASGVLYIAMALDGILQVDGSNGNILQYYTQSTISSPVGVALDGPGNLYVAQGTTVLEFNRAATPTVQFLATDPVGSLSPDSPQDLYLENIGTSNLTFPTPGTGTTNPELTDSTGSYVDADVFGCPLVQPGAAAGSMPPGVICYYPITFTPTQSGTINGTLAITDNTLGATATQTVNINNLGVPAIIPVTVTVNFTAAPYTGNPIPASITTSVSGVSLSVTYQPFGSSTPPTTTVPSAVGFYTVVATVTSPGYSGSGTGYLEIISIAVAPVITWPTPAPITVGTPLSATQLDATTTTGGTFTYTPALGAVLSAGTYTLSVNFQPTDTVHYTNASATVTLVVQNEAQSASPVDFGTVNIGSTSAAQTLTFTFNDAVTLNATTPVQISTQGSTNTEFINPASGTCASIAYSPSATCTVTVQFKPSYAGVRMGAVVLEDTSGNIVATAYVHGIGQGPQIAWGPGTSSTIAPGVGSFGVTADAAGNVYINTSGNVLKVAPGGTQTTVATGLSGNGLALDGAGNFYVASMITNQVLEVTPNGTVLSVGTGFKAPYGVAVDGAGNLFVADTENYQVEEITAAGVQTTVASGFCYPEGVAVDAGDNVYVADNCSTTANPTGGMVFKIAPGGAQSVVGTGFNSPYSVAVDTLGNVYVTVNTALIRISPSGVQSTLASGFSADGVALDPLGNIYVSAGASGGSVLELNRSTLPSLTFASTADGSTSSDSPQSVTVINIGNADLSFPATGSGTNASISSQYSLGGATTCPDSSAAGLLASGASCTYSVSFKPTTTGTIAGSLLLTDNNLNVTGASQTIALSGQGTASTITATVILTGLNQTYTGSPLAVSATTNPAGLTVAITYNGSTTAPTNPGSYAVVATVTQTGYTGSATGTLVIAPATPIVSVAPSAASITTAQPISETVSVACGKACPTGSVVLSGVGYTSASTVLVSGTATIVIPAGSLAVGTDTLTATFTPDANSSSIYTAATGQASVTVTAAIPQAAFNPAGPLSFTTAAGLSSAAQTVTLSNSGNAALSISSIAITGTNASSFSQTNTCGAALATGSNCSISVTFSPMVAGGDSASLTVTDNASGSPQTVALSGTATAPPSFTISSSTGTQTLSPGGTATYTLTVTPQNGAFTSAVTFAATGLPAGTTATFNPASVTPGSSAASATLTIAAPLAASAQRNFPWPMGAPLTALAGLLLLPRRWRRRWVAPVLLLAASLASLTALAGCGGGFALKTSSPVAYTITVTANGGGLSQTTTVQLTVQ